ncbi:cytochrome-c peroxidase [Undibacterium sp. TJN25]|uniref:cytochrome-c peroxidase n=1 Tax=Undibacterium sp. TJN25 TaxID=3413056 RepID=UPI003BF1A6C4
MLPEVRLPAWRIRLKICATVLFISLFTTACHEQGEAKNTVESTAKATTAAAPPIGSPVVAPPAKADTVTMWVRYPSANVTPSPAAALGKRLFFDPSLSASGKMSCATCHDPDHAYGPPNDLAVQLGGSDLRQPGTRSVPSLRYLQFTPKFTRHFAVPSPDGIEDEGPTGGFTHDGAVDSLHEQALLPLMNKNEMANQDALSVSAKLRQAAYADAFRQLYGPDIFDRPTEALKQATMALEAFQTEDPSFHPYTSKFDAAMSGNAAFTPQELHGYALFNNPNKGNCAKCHVDSPGPGGRPAQFTDFGLVALGVPRNPAIPANRDPKYFDLGACGPVRRDLAKESVYCGLFKTPTLRNAASRQVFFHNGVVHTLEKALDFYVERDTLPAKWYPKIDGKVIQFDDIPVKYRANINRFDAPMNRKPADPDLFDKAEIADLLAFMKTLNDGYSLSSGGKAAK